MGGESRPEIIAFLRFNPTLLHDSDATSDVNAWPTPRSWEMASYVLTGFAAPAERRFPHGHKRDRSAAASKAQSDKRPRSSW
jgi:hypothetical protein